MYERTCMCGYISMHVYVKIMYIYYIYITFMYVHVGMYV